MPRILEFVDGFSSATAPSTTGLTSVATATPTGGGTISLGSSAFQVVYLTPASAVSLATAPMGAPATGTFVTLIGSSDTNTVTITDADSSGSCLLNGDAILGKGETLTLVYHAANVRWYEVSRS
jgi:hypothetical protein